MASCLDFAACHLAHCGVQYVRVWYGVCVVWVCGVEGFKDFNNKDLKLNVNIRPALVSVNSESSWTCDL